MSILLKQLDHEQVHKQMQTVESKKGLFKLKQERETESEEKIILYFKPGDYSRPLQGGEIEAEIQMIWRNDFAKICLDSGAKALNWGKMSLPKSG